MVKVKSITPFLWFDNNAEEAMNLYTSLFEDSKAGEVRRYPEGSPYPAGTVMTASFRLSGQEFMALNGGPHFKFTEAVSFFVAVETQEQVDELWSKLTAHGGEESQCGWLKDRFGLSWQIAPTALGELMDDPDPQKSSRVMQAMMQMKKIDISKLKQAYDAA
jgi:predicted 3-demethylubiquinone-9 3-methyltransferase (glyoxalase superfamily)